ncbi:MAG TPA: hypothetical protein QGF05_00330 [Dehalococcoidia bacterium]|nr:hypothetical protein [Dehalococcoidia bacterium]
MVSPTNDNEGQVLTDEDAAASEEGEVEDALDMLFKGRVEEVIPPEEVGEFHDFIREEALRRRRFAVSFRLDCSCLAWIGYSLSNIVTHEDGMEFKARSMQTYIPDHGPDVEHPEGPTEDPPEEFEDWPIWPFEIYQDEMDAELQDEGADEYDEESGLDDTLDELAEEFNEADDLAGIRDVASRNDAYETAGE